MRTRIFSARALAFRPFDERFIKDLIRKRSRAEGQWKSQCHFLPSFRVKIGRPYLQPFLSCFGGRILRGSSRDRNRVHYLAGSSESHGSRKPPAHRTCWRARDAQRSSKLPGRCEGDSFPTLAEVSEAHLASITSPPLWCPSSSVPSNLSRPRAEASFPPPADVPPAPIVGLHANPRGPVRTLDRGGKEPAARGLKRFDGTDDDGHHN